MRTHTNKRERDSLHIFKSSDTDSNAIILTPFKDTESKAWNFQKRIENYIVKSDSVDLKKNQVKILAPRKNVIKIHKSVERLNSG